MSWKDFLSKFAKIIPTTPQAGAEAVLQFKLIKHANGKRPVTPEDLSLLRGVACVTWTSELRCVLHQNTFAPISIFHHHDECSLICGRTESCVCTLRWNPCCLFQPFTRSPLLHALLPTMLDRCYIYIYVRADVHLCMNFCWMFYLMYDIVFKVLDDILSARQTVRYFLFFVLVLSVRNNVYRLLILVFILYM